MIQVTNLSKRYGHTVAVDGLTFDVHPARVTGFLGPNGAGKSTTIRMIMDLDEPTSGQVRVGGRRYRDHRRPLHQVGAVLEARAVHPGRTAFNHLLCLAQSNGIGRRRVREVLDLVGLSDAAGRRAGGFSLGMSQRLGLASALLGDPPVIICDEPVNGLDPEGIRWIRTFLRGLAAEGRTVFVSSHLMSEMALTADSVIVIGRGRLLADESIEDMVRRPATTTLVRSPQATELTDLLHQQGATVRPGEAGELLVDGVDHVAIGELAGHHRITLHELTPQQASLEAAFLALTQDAGEFQAGQRS